MFDGCRRPAFSCKSFTGIYERILLALRKLENHAILGPRFLNFLDEIADKLP